MAITTETGRVPPGPALLQQIANARPFVPLLARPVVNPLLDTFAAYVVAMEARVAKLEGNL